MSTGPKTSWGGKRPGSGRKTKFDISDKLRADLMKLAKKTAKNLKLSIPEILLQLIYGNIEAMPKDRLQAIKIFYDILLPKTSEGERLTIYEGPKIILPEMQPDPAKLILEKLPEA